jgi:hypothetical protein
LYFSPSQPFSSSTISVLTDKPAHGGQMLRFAQIYQEETIKEKTKK